jgi:hypothetical protein
VTDLAPWLAWHFEAAGVWGRAAGYCLTAGHLAYRLSAHEEAIAHYRAGLALLERLPQATAPALRQERLRQELALHLGLGRPLGVMRGWASPEQSRTYELAYDLGLHLAEQGGVSPEFLLAVHAQITMTPGQGE